MNKQRKRKCITLPELVLDKMQVLCNDLDIKDSHYIEMVVRADLRKRGVALEPKIDKSKYIFDGNVEDMPLKAVENGR